ncbi:MAG: hypothetical protein J0L84_03795 [Verrucomicrobia bacterium]|nr:hypothetical protein [Verrucomicrobiota bacterium]
MKVGNALPIEYRVDFYDESFESNPTFSLESACPFQPFHVGDTINSRLWGDADPLPDTELFEVREVRHHLWQVKGSHIGHSVGVLVVPVSRDLHNVSRSDPQALQVLRA